MCRNESFDVMTSMFYVSIKPASNSPSQPITNTLLSAPISQFGPLDAWLIRPPSLHSI